MVGALPYLGIFFVKLLRFTIQGLQHSLPILWRSRTCEKRENIFGFDSCCPVRKKTSWGSHQIVSYLVLCLSRKFLFREEDSLSLSLVTGISGKIKLPCRRKKEGLDSAHNLFTNEMWEVCWEQLLFWVVTPFLLVIQSCSIRNLIMRKISCVQEFLKKISFSLSGNVFK